MSTQLSNFEERQKALTDASLSKPNPTQQSTSASTPVLETTPQPTTTSADSNGARTCGVPARLQFRERHRHQLLPYRRPTPFQGADFDRQNLFYIRLEYYHAMVDLKRLIAQVPDAEIDIRKQYLRHLLIRLDGILSQMHSEHEESKTAANSIGGSALYQQVMTKHRELMTRFTKMFKELAPQYRYNVNGIVPRRMFN
ncbi:hypothetical protein EC991_002142 [Linnemannia zychae]|nr:hypothetical protein EC991_002142 [Linnemannia zychae]